MKKLNLVMTLLLVATVSLSASAQYCTDSTCVVGEGYIERALNLDMKFAYVPKGEFFMGSEKGESDESHLHTVYLRGYYMSATEVTQAQWEAVMGTNVCQQAELAGKTCQTETIGDNYPMCYVSWEDAMNFCHELSRITGLTYTLPTEAQWEYAARYGGNDNMQYSGSYNVNAVATYGYNSNSCTEVGSRQPNSLGIYDMCGNVWEWCSDWYDDNYYSYSAALDPRGACGGTYRVHRGGSYKSVRELCTVTNRGASSPELCTSSLGFRVVLLNKPSELVSRIEESSFETFMAEVESVVVTGNYKDAAQLLLAYDLEAMYEAVFGENATEENEERIANVVDAILYSDDETAISMTSAWLLILQDYVNVMESVASL